MKTTFIVLQVTHKCSRKKALRLAAEQFAYEDFGKIKVLSVKEIEK